MMINLEDICWDMHPDHQAKLDAFTKLLPCSLTAIVIEHYPKAKECETMVFNIATEYIKRIWDLFDITYAWTVEREEPYLLDEVNLIKPKEEAELILSKELKKVPEDKQADYISTYWEKYYFKYSRQTYIHAIYMAMKKDLVSCCLDDILEWDSMYLRYFDRALYKYHVLAFVVDLLLDVEVGNAEYSS